MHSDSQFVYYGTEWIDEIQFVKDPSRLAQRMVVSRTYSRIRERLDLKLGAGWVALRAALQGGSSL